MFILCALLSISLSAELKILALAGSTRADSVNNKLVTNASKLARQEGAHVTLIDLKDFPLPFYDADFEKERGMPQNARKLRQLMMQNEVIFIASPEYNDSVSGVLKNTIDWASRNETGGSSRDAFKGKRFVIMSASPSAKGGINGLNHLKAIIESIGGEVIPKYVVVPNAYSAFDPQGNLKDPQKKEELQEIIRNL